MGYVIPNNVKKFKEDFEAAQSFDSIKEAHDTFINDLYNSCEVLWETNADSYGLEVVSR